MVMVFSCLVFLPMHLIMAQATCMNLPNDLFLGQNDSGSSGSILTLQNYLNSLGYLVATPNGHFGPATLLAVKAYQTANGISATGYVGPLTRALIDEKTCAGVTPSNTTVVNPSPQLMTPVAIAPPAIFEYIRHFASYWPSAFRRQYYSHTMEYVTVERVQYRS